MGNSKKDIQVCINPHFDAVSLWLGSFGGEDSPCDISRGVFAAKRGLPRLLELFNRYGITTTWGVTGHSVESFPAQFERSSVPAMRSASMATPMKTRWR